MAMYGSLAGSFRFLNLYKDKDIIPIQFFYFFFIGFSVSVKVGSPRLLKAAAIL